jgi:hypothetical protein
MKRFGLIRTRWIMALALGFMAVACGLNTAEAGNCIADRQEAFGAMTLPKALQPIPRVTCPLYVMEYHVWFRSPFGEGGRPGFLHWGPEERIDTETVGADWMRNARPVGQPLIGLYNAEDPNVIRWQIRCARNAGIDGMFVQLFPDRPTGKRLGGSHIFEVILKTTVEEKGPKVAGHDEVHFRRGWLAQKPEIMAERVGLFIKKYGKHPGYLRIKGMPAYNFQFYGAFQGTMSDDDLAGMIRKAEEIAGEKIFWVVNRDPCAFYGRPESPGFIGTANSNFIRPYNKYTKPKLDWTGLEGRLNNVRKAKKKYPDKMIGLWGYYGFDTSPYHSDGEISWLPRRDGQTLVEVLRRYVKEKPDFITLSAWNEWQENSAMEPGLNYDGYNGDPYFYCRIIAAAKGKRFVPPPLPPKESVDPLMWQTLYGIDRTSPKIVNCCYVPMDPGVTATAVDSGSAVKWIKAAYRGDVCLSVEDGRVVTQGIKAIPKQPKLEAGKGLMLEGGQSMTLEIKPDALTGKREMFYVAIEYFDEGKGRLEVAYPADPPVIDYMKMDCVNLPVLARVGLAGDGKWKAAVRLMRAFDSKAEKPTVQIRYRFPRGEKSGGKVCISRVHVFRDAVKAIDGVDFGHTADDSQVKTFRFRIPSLTGTPPTAVYLIAEDVEGNRSFPFPVMGSECHPTGIRPGRWLMQ